MRADRTVIVIGAFLFVIGLAVAWNGYGYVQLERGWTQVISGTISACTGLLLVALGLVLRELETIAASAERATLLLARGRSAFPVETASAPPAPASYEQPPAPSREPPAAAYAPAYDEPPVPHEEPLARESSTPPPEEIVEPAAEALAEAPAPSETSVPRQDSPLSWMVRANRAGSPLELRLPRAETSDGWLRKPLAGPAEELVEEPPVPEPEHSRETIASALEPTWREAELSLESPHEEVVEDLYALSTEIAPEPAPNKPEPYEIAPEPEAEPQHVQEPVQEVYHEPVHEPVQESVQQPVQEPVEHSAQEIHHEPVAETVDEGAHHPAAAEPAPDAPKPEIIGHYDAQGAHYTLYADGTIEAETPHGVYRFASMAELKRFIEGQA